MPGLGRHACYLGEDNPVQVACPSNPAWRLGWIAVAAAIPGTLVARVLGGGRHDEVRFGHPSGTLTVGAHASEENGTWTVNKALMSRSARRLMEGRVFVPADWLR